MRGRKLPVVLHSTLSPENSLTAYDVARHMPFGPATAGESAGPVTLSSASTARRIQPTGVTERALQLLVAGQQRIEGYRRQIAEIDAKLGGTPQEQLISQEEQRLQAMREQQKEEQQRLTEAVRSLSV
jgi:hypothetical protein